jgi:hypothetical protein
MTVAVPEVAAAVGGTVSIGLPSYHRAAARVADLEGGSYLGPRRALIFWARVSISVLTLVPPL